MFYLMQIYSTNKKDLQQSDYFSLPNIKNNHSAMPAPQNHNSKLKLTIKRQQQGLKISQQLDPVTPSFILPKNIINLEEINKKASVDNLLKEHLYQRKKIKANRETIDLWKLKHDQSPTAKNTPRHDSLNPHESIKHLNKTIKKHENNNSQEMQPLRKNSFKANTKLENYQIPQQFQVKKIYCLKQQNLRTTNLKISPQGKGRKKIPLISRYRLDQGEDCSWVPEHPSKWQVKKFGHTEEDDSLMKSRVNDKDSSQQIQILPNMIP